MNRINRFLRDCVSVPDKLSFLEGDEVVRLVQITSNFHLWQEFAVVQLDIVIKAHVSRSKNREKSRDRVPRHHGNQKWSVHHSETNTAKAHTPYTYLTKSILLDVVAVMMLVNPVL